MEAAKCKYRIAEVFTAIIIKKIDTIEREGNLTRIGSH
jgi:hypothetical protein